MSGAPLDMTLDDLIKRSKNPTPCGRGGRVAAGPGPSRRGPNRSANRAAPYAPPRAPESAWGHEMFPGGGGGGSGGGSRASSIEMGTKLYISNLDYGVSMEDIKGTAEVVFSRRNDAAFAVKRYNNVQLDDKPIKIELVGTNITAPAAGLPRAGAFGDSNLAPRSGPARGGFGGFGRPRGGGPGRGSGRGRGRGRGRGEKVSAYDLDAGIEKYHAETM